MTDVQEESSYQANTVEELRDELRTRGLHTSGNKDELVARLEEDDAKLAAGESTEQADAEINAQDTGTVEPPTDPYATVYSPYELPAVTEVAQAFQDANPTAVDPSLVLDDLRMAQAQEAITQYGSPDDPRLSGGPAVEEAPAEAEPESDTSETEPPPAEEPVS